MQDVGDTEESAKWCVPSVGRPLTGRQTGGKPGGRSVAGGRRLN